MVYQVLVTVAATAEAVVAAEVAPGMRNVDHMREVAIVTAVGDRTAALEAAAVTAGAATVTQATAADPTTTAGKKMAAAATVEVLTTSIAAAAGVEGK